MNVNERLVVLLATRADRLANPQAIDRKAVTTLPDVPPRSLPDADAVPASPWAAARSQLCAHGAFDSSAGGDQLLDALLNDGRLTPDELRRMYAHPNLTDRQRARVLQHAYVPGELVVAHVCDPRHDTTMFSGAALDEQLAMLQGAAGLTGEQRMQAWATLLVRVASAQAVQDATTRLLMVSPDASAVLTAAVARAFAITRNVPGPLGRQLLSHMSTPAAIASMSLPCAFRLLDEAEQAMVRTDRFADLLCDMIGIACGPEPHRWEKLFRLSQRWDASIDALLDEVEGSSASRPGRRREVPGYQRDHRSPLLRPIGNAVSGTRVAG